MARQLDLFAIGAPAFDPAFRSLHRVNLSHGAWIDHAPGWVGGHDALFDELERVLPWRSEKMIMYDREVDVPRLLARVEGHALVEHMRVALSEKYGEEFLYTTAALYRDGHDSVAFHGDTTARDMIEAVVATVSLGAPRRFILRPTATHHGDPGAGLPGGGIRGGSIALPLGRGDLVVMGGTCQRTWRHGIPKVAKAGPRIAVMFRPAWASEYRTTVTS